MTTNGKDWLRGTLPAWIATSLIALLCFVGIKYLDHVNGRLQQVDRNTQDILVIGQQTRSLQEAVLEMKAANREVVAELRMLNAQLRK